MTPLYQDPHFTFRFAEDRLIPRFHREGVEAGRRISAFQIDPGTGERLGLLMTAAVGEGAGWTWLSRSSCRPARGSSPCPRVLRNHPDGPLCCVFFLRPPSVCSERLA